MGWYGDSNITCPNCKTDNAACIFRNNMRETYYLVCNNCGLHLYAEYTAWIVTNSYIDKSVIGKDLEDMLIEDIVDHERNEDIIVKGSHL